MTTRPVDREEIFNNAAEIEDIQQRADYLQEACQGDRELIAEIEELLPHDAIAGTFLEHGAIRCDGPQVRESAISERPGQRIGPYKLSEQIGEGGFGIVYLAEQTEPVKRRVALKIIKPGMDTREVIARFQAERQALALMDHPNIAKVFDAGATESGRPYFVMELVKGIPLTDYCDQCHLAPRDRLQLFLQVCQAIQHAHQKGVIHRDVKPGNVLIAMQDGKPVPKVIDFGVAKAINQRLTDHTLMTRFAQVIGTPLYMSPEQAEMSPLDVDTRSDIYSLGVLLYELLTGTTPFERERLKEATFDEMRRIIREEEPLRPSARISTLGVDGNTIAEKRRTEPRKLRQVVSGDLDWIAMKALEKDRTRRYETASSLAEDVQRYLHDEPVQACPPSAAYRFRKFARRNKLALTTTIGVAAAVVVLAVGASIAAVNFEQLASEKAILAQEKTDALDAATTEQMRAERNLDLALEALDAVYLDAIGEQKLLGPPPSLAADGGLDGAQSSRPTLTNLERTLLERGLTFYDQFARQNQDAPQAAAQTARAFRSVALLQGALVDRPTAEVAFNESIERFQALLRNEPENHSYWHELGQTYYGLSVIQSDWDSAQRIRSQADEAITRAIEIDPGAAEYYHSRSEVRAVAGDDRHAQQDAEHAVELAPDNLDFRLTAAATFFNCPVQIRDYKKAVEHCEQALKLEPQNLRAHQRYANVLYYLDRNRALEHLAKAIEIDPTAPYTYNQRARIYMERGDYQRALADADQAVRLAPEIGGFYLTSAAIHTRLGNFDRARAELAAAEQRIPAGTRARRLLYEKWGWLHLSIRDYVSAVDDYTRCIELAPQLNFHYAYRCLAYFFLREFGKSLADLRTSFELAPEDRFALFRLPGHAIANCPDAAFRDGYLNLAREVMAPCNVPHHWASYADLLTACGRYDDAEEAYERALNLGLTNDLHTHLYRFALLQFWRGKREEAQRNCGRLLNEFADTNRARTANFAAWACCLAPDTVADYGSVIDLAERAVGSQPKSATFLKTLGAALLRAGRYQEAIDRLEESDAHTDDEPHDAWYLLALAHQALGREEEARSWLAKANEWTEQALASTKAPPEYSTRMTLELLRNEANSLIEPDLTDEAPQQDRASTLPPAPPATQRSVGSEPTTE